MKCADAKYIRVHPDDGSRHSCNFTEFESIPTKTEYTLISIGSDPEVYEMYNTMVVCLWELPNCLVHTNPNQAGSIYSILKHENKVIKFLTNCPFSVDYFNQQQGYDKFQFVYAPINKNYFPSIKEKLYDVYYTGHFPNPISPVLPVIRKFNHCIVSRSPEATHHGVGHIEKMNLNAQSKSTIIHNLLLWPDHYKNASDHFSGHGALEAVKKIGLAPQIKSRTMEAAISKSVILSLHDPWNMIESYFEPEVDFIYWYDEKDLEEKIRHISKHYEDYIPMVERAYNKVVNNWVRENFFNDYLKDL